MVNHRTIIDMWPRVDDLAADMGLKPRTVRSWKQRNSIPSWHWHGLLNVARQRRIYVTHEDLIVSASIERRAA